MDQNNLKAAVVAIVVIAWTLCSAASNAGMVELRPCTVCSEAQSGEELLTSILDEIESRRRALNLEVNKFTSEKLNEVIQEVLDKEIRDNEESLTQITSALLTTTNIARTHRLYCALIHHLAKNNNGRLIADAISVRCPPYVYDATIEEYLIIMVDDWLHDGTIVLCDAYDKAKNEVAKRELAAALRRGFRFVGPLSDDKTLSSDVRGWYKKNRYSYTPNIKYLGHSRESFEYDRIGVFTRKTEN